MFQEYENTIQILVDKIHYAENSFHKQHGKYFQSLPVGIKGELSVPQLFSKAYHEPNDLPTIDFTDEIPFEIEIHEHVNFDLGEGYTIFFRGIVDSKEYIKSIGQGIGFTKDWYEHISIDFLNNV